MAGILGAQLDQGHFVIVEHFQGYAAPSGVTTRLPIVLADSPATKGMMKVVVGNVGEGGYQQRQGVDWDIDLATRTVFWLGRTALLSTQWISFFYCPFAGGSASAFAWR